MKKITSSNYKKDKLYPGVARAMAELVDSGGVVAPVEVLLRLGRITKEQYEDWRFGRIPYLERVCLGNLSKINRILRILDRHARSQGLTPSQTVYRKWGRGGKRIVLRFSKSGHPNLEAAYSRHYLTKRARAATRRKTSRSGKAQGDEKLEMEDGDARRAAPHRGPVGRSRAAAAEGAPVSGGLPGVEAEALKKDPGESP